MADLTALALTCSLTPSPEPSSSELLARHVLDELQAHGVGGDSWRAMHTVDYKDLHNVPEKTAATTAGAARNATHLARALTTSPYPAG